MPLTDQERDSRVQVIQTYWDALIGGDLETFRTLLADDVVIHYPGQHGLSGDYHGPDEVVGLYTQLTQWVQDGIFNGQVLDIMVGEIHTAVVIRYDLVLPGRTIPGRAIGLFRIEGGLIREYWLHEWDQVMINRVFRLGSLLRPLMGLMPKKKPKA